MPNAVNTTIAAPRARTVSALIIDAHATTAGVLRAFLAPAFPQLEILIAQNAGTAMAINAAQRPALVLVDIHLPDANGIELLPALRAACPVQQAVVLTLQDGPLYKERARAAGATAYLTKEHITSALIPLLQSLLPDE